MDGETYFRFLLALVFVLALIALLAWLARRFGVGSGLGVRTTGVRRLRISEVAAVDGKHRLVLVRRDDVEHLLLLGPGGDTLVESGIPAPAADEPPPPRPELTSFKAHIARLMHPAQKDGQA